MALALASSSPATATPAADPAQPAPMALRIAGDASDAAQAGQDGFPDLSRYSESQRNEALQRLWCVEAIRSARQFGRMPMNLVVERVLNVAYARFPNLKVSRGSLYKWDAKIKTRRDVTNLVDHRGGDMKHAGDADAWSAFKDLYLHENAPTIRQCWHEVKRLAAFHGWGWCSYPACVRQLDKKIPPQDQISARHPAMYRSHLQPFIEQHPESWEAGGLWIGDHKQCDLVCRWAKTLIRPWLTVWKDWRTRKVCGWVLSDNPNSTTILAALRHGLIDPTNLGGPAEVWIDNGRDFDSWLFHGQTKSARLSKIKPSVDEGGATGIFNALQITPHFSLAYNPNGKARLERWFRTLTPLFKTFETYTGEGPDTKPERLNEILKSPRLIPTFQTVKDRIAAHIEGFNNSVDHSMDNLSEDGQTISPNEAYARWCQTKRVMADPAALDLCLQHWHRPVPVTRNGIAITLAGRAWHYGQYAHELSPFKAIAKESRRMVNVSYDPHDMGSIHVYDEKWRFLCIAAMNEVGGLEGKISREHLQTVSRNKAAYERDRRFVAEHALTSILTPEEQAANVAENERRDDQADAARTMRMVTTPLDRQSLPVAIGAENISFPARPPLLSPSQMFRNAGPRDRYEEFPAAFDLAGKLRKQALEARP